MPGGRQTHKTGKYVDLLAVNGIACWQLCGQGGVALESFFLHTAGHYETHTLAEVFTLRF